MASSSEPSTLATQVKPKKVMGPGLVFLTSGLGGMVGWAVIHPANTLAVRMSLNPPGTKFSLSAMLAKSGGIYGLYDGLSAGILRQAFYATSRFGLFETFRDILHEYRGKTDFASRVGIGAITGGMAAYISCPMEVCVVRMSNNSTLSLTHRQNYKGVIDVASRIVKEEGFLTFWNGSNPFVVRAMMVGVFQVATLDQFKELFTSYFGQTKDSLSNVFSSAMASGLVYSVATMPLEACKNRMASQKADPVTGKVPYTGIIQTMRKVSATEGMLALYNGFFPYYIRCGGHTVAMFLCVQMLRDAYSKYA
jgi:solute carrier family 25 (mitochondrial oxoglutarate transporter), member 11